MPFSKVISNLYIHICHCWNATKLLQIIEDETGESGQISLLLFQAIMFAGTAVVDMQLLRSAGYSNRKNARKAFFQKVRVCSR
jgi:hypothetical protein